MAEQLSPIEAGLTFPRLVPRHQTKHGRYRHLRVVTYIHHREGRASNKVRERCAGGVAVFFRGPGPSVAVPESSVSHRRSGHMFPLLKAHRHK